MGDPITIGLVLIILVLTVYLFATEKFPVDLVAMMVLGALLLVTLLSHWGILIDPNNWISAQDGVSGFSNSATITVAAMFVLSAGLEKTGAMQAVGRLLIRWGKNQFVLLTLIMVTVGVVSAFANNTAAVAVFLPLVLATAARRKISPSKLLIPLSFASQFGGVCTLIGTSTNLLVSEITHRSTNLGEFGMFEFSQLGMIMFAAGVIYFLVLGRWLLPSRPGEELTETYQLGEYMMELRVLENSSLIDSTTTNGTLGSHQSVKLLEILRDKEKVAMPWSERIREGDVLLVEGKVRDLMELKTTAKLDIEPHFKLRDELLHTKDTKLVEAVVTAHSPVEGKTVAEMRFHHSYDIVILAIQRRGHVLRRKLKSVRLQFGDALLLQGSTPAIKKLRDQEVFVILEQVSEPTFRRHKIPLALGIFAGVVAIAALNIMPIMTAAIFGCIALVLTRCISLSEAYGAIDWKVIFLLAGVLPLGIAMEKSGAAAWIALGAMKLAGAYGPTMALVALYLLAQLLTAVMSNNATAVLLAPIAISTAVGLSVSPKPMLMAVMFAASTCFATPVGYQTNAMIYNPGGYKFSDFMRVGLPLNVLFMALAVYYIPKFWPF